MDKDHIRILLIEDDEDDYAIVRELLSGLSLAHFSLEWVKTYQEGLKELCRCDHDAYLLDYRLGSRNGLELIREATGAGCDKPVIFLTSQGDRGVDMEAIRSGASDYLVKAQLTADMIERSIRYSIARKKSERELKSYRDRLEDLVRERTEELETAYEELQVEIVERKQAEVTLLESENKFKSFAEQALAGIYIIQDGVFKYVNPKFAQLFGYTVEECMNEMPFKNLVYAEDLTTVEEQVGRRSSGEAKSVHYTFRGLKKNGQIFHVEIYGSAIVYKGELAATGTILDITERKQTEDALRESGKRYKQLLESVTDYIFTVQVQDNRPLATVHGPGCVAVTGYTSGDYEADPFLWYQMVYEQDRDAVKDQTAKLLSGEEVSPLEHRIIHRDGSIRWVRNTTVQHYDEQRKLIAYDGMITNITERKQAEEELRASEARLRQIIDLVPHMIFVKDWEGKYLLVNKAVAEGYNTSVSGLTGKYHNDFHPVENELQDMLRDDREVIMKGKMKFIPEEPYTDVHGNLRILQVTKVPFHIFGDKTLAVLGVAIDITERKRVEESLRESEARLDLALRSAHMGVWRLELIENKHHFDDQVCHLLGIDPAKFTGTAEQFYKAVHPDDREMLMAALARSIEHDVLYETEYRAVWPDSSVHYLRARGKLYRDEAGRPTEINAVLWDVTEVKSAEKEREKLEAQLRQSQKVEAIGMLAGGIAHDFNNILQPIIGYTEMELLELPPTSPMRESLEQVLNASLRAKELVKQILAVSRSTEEEQRIPIDISSIIKEALKLLRSSLPTSIEVRQNIREGLALADPTQIHQVLMNLCTNALHAMDGKGILEVRLSPVDLSESDLADQYIFDLKPGPYLRLEVSDTGCGMDAETMERIFDPYFTTKEVGKGTGLGLAVVSGIVRRHEGAITVRSEPGKGTRFSIYIPRLDAQSEGTRQVDGPLQRGSERLLFVDDEPAIMEMGTSILKRLGYKVTSQTDSVKALEVFRSSPDEFDLVITDYTMPKLTGLDFAREVLRIRPDIPVLLCTGFSEKLTPDSLKAPGMGLLMKPYNMRQISEAVRKILEAQKGD